MADELIADGPGAQQQTGGLQIPPGVQLSDRELTALKRALSNALPADQLIALYENCEARSVHPFVLESMRVQIWSQHPAPAAKKFGRRQNDPMAALEQHRAAISARHNGLPDNKHGNHVKVGGDMLTSGENSMHVDVYISYKRADGEVAYLALRQRTPATPMEAVVGRYRTGRDAYQAAPDVFPRAQLDEAAAAYEAHLVGLLTTAHVAPGPARIPAGG